MDCVDYMEGEYQSQRGFDDYYNQIGKIAKRSPYTEEQLSSFREREQEVVVELTKDVEDSDLIYLPFHSWSNAGFKILKGSKAIKVGGIPCFTQKQVIFQRSLF